MKKTLLVLAAAAALVFGLASCNTPSNSGAKEETKKDLTVTSTADIKIEKNYNWTAEGTKDGTTFSNYQVVLDLIADWTPAVGDKIKISLEGTASQAIKVIQANIVDNTEAAGWWKVLNEPIDVVFAGSTAEDATAVTALKTDSEFVITTAATAKGAAKLVVYLDPVTSAGYADKAAAYTTGPASIDLTGVKMTITLTK